MTSDMCHSHQSILHSKQEATTRKVSCDHFCCVWVRMNEYANVCVNWWMACSEHDGLAHKIPKEKFGLCATRDSQGLYQNAFASEAACACMYEMVMNMQQIGKVTVDYEKYEIFSSLIELARACAFLKRKFQGAALLLWNVLQFVDKNSIAA